MSSYESPVLLRANNKQKHFLSVTTIGDDVLVTQTVGYKTVDMVQ